VKVYGYFKSLKGTEKVSFHDAVTGKTAVYSSQNVYSQFNRRLERGEEIGYINGNAKDYRLSNLKIKEHVKEVVEVKPREYKRIPRIQCECAQCGAKFERLPGRMSRVKGALVFCSRKCAGQHSKENPKHVSKRVPCKCNKCDKDFVLTEAKFAERMKSLGHNGFCSIACSAKSRDRGMIKYNCEQCGKEMEIKRYRYDYGIKKRGRPPLCSNDCARERSFTEDIAIELREKTIVRCRCSNCAEKLEMAGHIYRKKFNRSNGLGPFCNSDCAKQYRSLIKNPVVEIYRLDIRIHESKFGNINPGEQLLCHEPSGKIQPTIISGTQKQKGKSRKTSA
jgi:hypothetical protein